MPRCPRGTRRNKSTGLCEGCPPGTVRARNGRCNPAAPAPAPPAPAHAPYERVPGDPIAYPLPTHLNAVQMTRLKQIIQTYTGIVLDLMVFMYVLLGNYHSGINSNVGPVLEYANTILQRIQWSEFIFNYSVDYILDTFKSVIDLLNKMSVPVPDRPKAYKIYAKCIEYVLKATQAISNTQQADAKLRATIPILPDYLLDELIYTPEDTREISIQKIHEDLRDNGAFYTDRGRFYLIPVAFFKPSVVPLKQTRVVYPATMTDLEDYSDIPFNASRTTYLCIVIKDGKRIHAFSVPLKLLYKGVNPRTPEWMYMKCKGPSHSLSITDAEVYSNRLYLNIAKMGVPQPAYVDINELNTALNAGHEVIILQPKEVSGTKLITQISSAYLYKVPQNAVGSSHCEVGQMGGFYEVYVTRRGRFL